MRKWGIVITTFYALVIMLLIAPGYMFFIGGNSWSDGFEVYRSYWLTWVWTVVLLGSHAALLLVPVDSSWRRLKPRQHILVSLTITTLLLSLLTFAAVWSLTAGIVGDRVFEPFGSDNDVQIMILVCWLSLWLLWGVLFFFYAKREQHLTDKLVGLLLKGSVLELLIAVPCHVIVRHRGDCSAPAATGFGIATGIAIMLLSFGPGVLFLYDQRMKQYEKSKSGKAFSEDGQPTDGEVSSESALGASSDEPSS